jgi:hypothetical protein
MPKKTPKLRINFYRRHPSDNFAFNMVVEDNLEVRQVMATISALPPSTLTHAYVFNQHGIIALQTWRIRDGAWEEE